MSSIQIRPASLAAGDAQVLGDLWESQFAWLISTGSEQQFGNIPYRERWPDTDVRYRQKIERSDASADQPFGVEWTRIFVAEADTEEIRRSLPTEVQDQSRTEGQSGEPKKMPVAAMVLEGMCDDEDAGLPEQDAEDPFIVIDYLMSNRNAGTLSKGAAVQLIAHAKEQALSMGIRRLCLICFAGNERRLIRYYEQQGFSVLREFVNHELERELAHWPGAVLEMRF